MLPLLPAAAYLAILAGRFGMVVNFWDGDVASTPVLGEELARHAGGKVYLAADPFINWLYFDFLTAGFAGHRGLWTVAPFLLILGGIAVLGVTIGLVFGWRWAVLSCAVAVCASALTLPTTVAQNIHESTWVTDFLLAALLCYGASRSVARRRNLVLAAVVAGVVVGVNYVSDPLLLGTGMAPFVVAAVAAFALRRSPSAARALSLAVGVTIVAGVTSYVVGRLVRHAGIIRLENIRPSLVGPHLVVRNAGWAWRNLNQLAGAPYQLGPAAIEPPLIGFVHGAMVVGALLIPVYLLARAPWWREVAEDGRPTQRVLFVTFWVASAAAPLLAFLLTDIAVDTLTGRYLVPVFYAAAALLGAVAAVSWRSATGVLAASTLFCITAVPAIRDNPFGGADPAQAAVLAELQRQHLVRGYGGYYMANPLTYHAGGGLVSRTVHERCLGQPAAIVCPHPLNSITSWYVPHPGQPTFVIWSPADASMPTQPGPEYGVPTRNIAVGNYVVSVYPYDVAERFATGLP
ncbi:MAG: hypothetical protein NVSMB17_12860 [Candidatus Dormibacteria bacterium]